MSDQTHEKYADPTTIDDATRRAAHGTTGTGAAAAMAQEPWDDAKSHLNPFEQKLDTFINRRISAQPAVPIQNHGRLAYAVEYLPGGTGLGRLKVETNEKGETAVVDVDETIFEMLLAKIINV